MSSSALEMSIESERRLQIAIALSEKNESQFFVWAGRRLRIAWNQVQGDLNNYFLSKQEEDAAIKIPEYVLSAADQLIQIAEQDARKEKRPRRKCRVFEEDAIRFTDFAFAEASG